MSDVMAPIFKVTNAVESADWYSRLGFEVMGQHRFAPHLPLFLFLERKGVHLYLSEHEGDAPPMSLAYFWIDDVEAVAEEFGVAVRREPWAREIELVDPDGNRLRVGTAS